MLVSRSAQTASPVAAAGTAPSARETSVSAETGAGPHARAAPDAPAAPGRAAQDFLARAATGPARPCSERFQALTRGCDVPALTKAVEALQRKNTLVRPAHLGHALDAGEPLPLVSRSRVALYDVLDAVVARWWKPVAPQLTLLREELLGLAAGGEHLAIDEMRFHMHQLLTSVPPELTEAESALYDSHRSASPSARNQTFETFSISQHVEVGIDTALKANWNALAYLQEAFQAYLVSGARLPSTDPAVLARQPFLNEGFNLVRYSATLQLSQAMHFLNELRLQRLLINPRIHNPFQVELRDNQLHLSLKPRVARRLVRFHQELVDRLNQSELKVRLGCPALRAQTPGQGHAVGTLSDFVKEVGVAHVLEPTARRHLAASEG